MKTIGYHNHFRVLEVEDYITLCDDLSIHTIELEKFVTALEKTDKPLEKWSYFMKNCENLESDSLPPQLDTPGIKKAVKVLKAFTQDEKEREIYESRKKALIDQASLISDNYNSGLEKGLEKGKQIGLEKGEQIALEKMVKKALQKGLVGNYCWD